MVSATDGRCGCIIMPSWLKTLSTGDLLAGTANIDCTIENSFGNLVQLASQKNQAIFVAFLAFYDVQVHCILRGKRQGLISPLTVS